ncbi:RNA polymerase sigma-70 factor [soil metagenome]
MNDLERQRKKLFGLAYRMTGSAADADDVVQETYLRATAQPPAPGNVEPWLVTVALNVARDRLRKRRRERYVGSWLPSPIDVSELDAEPLSPDDRGTEARYSMLESVSFAFLLALEALTPLQRAVLLLRDVLDYSAKETAVAIGSTEGAVKVQLLRARRRIASYEKTRITDSAATQETLVRFLGALRDADANALESLLASDAVCKTDGGGEFIAAGIDLIGPKRIAAALLGITKKTPPTLLLRFEVRALNGLPFFVAEQESPSPRIARHFAMACELDERGKIRAFYTVLASRKLSALRL